MLLRTILPLMVIWKAALAANAAADAAESTAGADALAANAAADAAAIAAASDALAANAAADATESSEGDAADAGLAISN